MALRNVISGFRTIGIMAQRDDVAARHQAASGRKTRAANIISAGGGIGGIERKKNVMLKIIFYRRRKHVYHLRGISAKPYLNERREACGALWHISGDNGGGAST
jgi:hypothetical protein